MFRKYAFRVIMFAPTASPVVHRQRTWHIGPTTCVFTSRSLANREMEGSSCSATQLCISSTSLAIQLASSIASATDLQTKQDALVILSYRTYVLNPPDSAAALAPRKSESDIEPSVCASGTKTSSVDLPRSTTLPSGSLSSYCPSEIVSGPMTAVGITESPVRASCAFAHGVRSCSNTSRSTRPSSASCRALIEAGSFFRGQRRNSTAAG